MKLKFVNTDDLPGLHDWWLIERAEHDGRSWWEDHGDGSSSLRMSCRITNADVEGTGAEMFAIAKAIRENGYCAFRRCAVDARGRKRPVKFWSPRNSQGRAEVTREEALDLAEQIERSLGR